MATELGKAYVQIMPSAKGISGSIQKAIAPEATAAGKSAGRNIATAIANSLNKVGSMMTKYITTPALAATTAVTGLVSALGFKRLIGMDNAQAKLKGLGVEGKQLEIVMKNAKDAVTGTTHTMADAVNVAAGALAAGVKEGKELERYIKLVGDAATGANAPMGEMAQIFNRIQGTGKLMGTELEMIEYRLPGFSQALAKHLGVAPEAMRKMVSEGKVSVDDFLAVMEGYAGGMSAAYAETWSGLKDNILANIGIIGEALLQGLFVDGKKGMAEFLQVLRESESLKEWARTTGETLRNVFGAIVNAIKTVVSWWMNLDGSTRTAILSFMGFSVIIGPILSVVGKLINVFTKTKDIIGKVKNAFVLVKGAIIGISGPTLLIIGAIAALIATFVGLYKTNEDFRNMVHTVWEGIKNIITSVVQAVSVFVTEIFGRLVAWWKENSVMILQAAQNVWNAISATVMTVLNVIWSIMQAIWPVVQALVISTWEAIKGAIEGAINVITGIVQFFSALFTGNWSALWDSVKQIVSGAVQLIWNLINVWIVGKVVKLVKSFFSIFRNIFTSGFNLVRNITSTALNAVKNIFSRIFNGLRNIVSGAFGKVKDAISSGMSKAIDVVSNFFGKFKDAGKNIITSIADGIKGAISKVTDAISNVTQKIRNFLPFSPPKEGPLIDIMDVKWGETISAGILKGEGEIASAMERALDFDLTRQASFESTSNMGGNEVVRLLNELIRAVREGKQIIINDRELAQIIEPGVTEIQERNKKVRSSFA